jgi:hypothetical protein
MEALTEGKEHFPVDNDGRYKNALKWLSSYCL